MKKKIIDSEQPKMAAAIGYDAAKDDAPRLTAKGKGHVAERIIELPAPMLRSLKTLLSGARVPVQISIEEKMACGIGACLACAVRTESGYVRVCTEGPVFDLDKVELD